LATMSYRAGRRRQEGVVIVAVFHS